MTSGTRAAALIAGMLVALAGCGGDSAGDESRAVPQSRGVATTTRATEGVVACATVDVVATLDAFYEKCLMREGLLVATAAEVPDAALEETLRLVEAMTAKRPDVRATLYKAGIFTAVLGANQQTTDIPEYAHLADDPEVDWNTRARGFGSAGPFLPTLVAEEDVLCYESDLWNDESVAVHEFAHSFFDQGILAGRDGAQYQERLTDAYAAAMDAGLWTGTYAATNESEYWAAGVQLYFDSIARMEIEGRDELVAYDPALAALIAELLPKDWTYACP